MRDISSQDIKCRWNPLLETHEVRDALKIVEHIRGHILTQELPSALNKHHVQNMQCNTMFLSECQSLSRRRDASKYLGSIVDTLSCEMFLLSDGLRLFDGATGRLWAVINAQLDPHDYEQARNLFRVCDDLLGSMITNRNLTCGHDLVAGLTGYLVYALKRPVELINAALVDCIVQALVEQAEDLGFCMAVRCPSQWHFGKKWGLDCRTPVYDLGLAHGLAGFVSILATACNPACHSDVRVLLERSVKTLEDSLSKTEIAARLYISGRESKGAAWCYGLLSSAIALRHAGFALRDRDLETRAITLALRIGGEAHQRQMFEDDCLCHGAAGFAHIMNRFYQSTGEILFREVATCSIRDLM